MTLFLQKLFQNKGMSELGSGVSPTTLTPLPSAVGAAVWEGVIIQEVGLPGRGGSLAVAFEGDTCLFPVRPLCFWVHLDADSWSCSQGRGWSFPVDIPALPYWTEISEIAS